ncbi:TetR/AcrR family transcriptional regulator [Clostridium neuense]|uniref:TetR/AcrR family transcriptional regulator n=1 Tax=Clostridium neuense TaxID=1728934 RepID=A0ABW8T917_9CLOT
MYTRSKNLQALQSQKMITNALLALMKVYPYSDITITQICQEAKVVRQTFYRNFETKLDILELYLDDMAKKYESDYFDAKLDAYQILKDFFDFSLLYKDLFKLLEKNNLFFLLNKVITMNMFNFSYIPKITAKIEASKLDAYVSDFIASTICSIFSLWVKNNFQETTEALADLAKVFLMGVNTNKVG